MALQAEAMKPQLLMLLQTHVRSTTKHAWMWQLKKRAMQHMGQHWHQQQLQLSMRLFQLRWQDWTGRARRTYCHQGQYYHQEQQHHVQLHIQVQQQLPKQQQQQKQRWLCMAA
jgi:hypothetical protein